MQAIARLRVLPASPAEPRRYRLAKRFLDFALSLLALLCLSPLLALCALAIWLDSPGPVLFRQQRVGERGEPFTLYKFRSMRANADSRPHQEYVATFIQGKAARHATESGELYKLVGDPRATRVGTWLRRTSLDELPQLWNVLRGEMSLVGPRPPIPYELEHYQPEQRRRLAVKPGITGLWQVSGRNRTTFEQMVTMDLEYIQNRSLTLDLLILLRTVPTVLLGRDAR